MTDPLLETWQINARVVLYVLDAVDEAVFVLPAPAKGRSAPQMFAHIHDVRAMWLASGKALPDGVAKLGKQDRYDRDSLRVALHSSGDAIAAMVGGALASGKRISGFKPHPPAFVGYLISHEGYHLGEIGVALREAGHPLDRKTAFGMWEWGVR
ncbi:MAG: DinB family protein [Caldilineales bacterium]